MKLRIENETSNVYEASYGVTTIQLGDGATTISTVNAEDGFHGICFSEAIENNGVGAEQKFADGDTVVTIDAYLQIITTNPDSLDVLIARLQEAKELLVTNQVEG